MYGGLYGVVSDSQKQLEKKQKEKRKKKKESPLSEF
jgi:hypothetical protein